MSMGSSARPAGACRILAPRAARAVHCGRRFPAGHPQNEIMRRPALTLSYAIAIVSSLAACAHAAEAVYPQRPVRLIIPQSPGGASDTVGRIVAQKLAERVGQPIVADNRPGATGNIG